jgi:hypothetical protein
MLKGLYALLTCSRISYEHCLQQFIGSCRIIRNSIHRFLSLHFKLVFLVVPRVLRDPKLRKARVKSQKDPQFESFHPYFAS